MYTCEHWLNSSSAVRVEMVDTTNASDIIFPRDSQELVNFTAFSSVAQITIPAEAIAMIAETNSTDGISVKNSTLFTV